LGVSLLDINTFYTLFRANQSAYGVTDVTKGEYDEKGKFRAESRLVHQAPTPAVVGRHLNGEVSMGLMPIDNDGMCSWGAIDIDSYHRSLDRIVKAIYDFDIPLVPCYSKSKKLHLFIFFKASVPPRDVQALFRVYFSYFDLDDKTEMFPKQRDASSTAKSYYSWINLPYFGETRRSLNEKMEELPFSTALQQMASKQLTLKEHLAFLEQMPFSDAPPCIQSGCILRDIPQGNRNNFLFSVGVYFRLKDEGADLDSLVSAVNRSLIDPIDESRLQETILTGLKKKSYFYLCASMAGCKKEECRNRDYGIESKETTGLEYGELEQYRTDPPYYVWTVSGKKMVFYNESEMLHQNKFRELCHRYLHIVPRKLNDDRWTKILNRANEHIVIHDVLDKEGGFSHGSQFLQNTIDFFVNRRPAQDKTQLALGRTWHDKSTDTYVFKSTSYLSYIRNVKDFKVYSPIELQTKLQELGAVQEGSFWRIPTSKIPLSVEEQVVIDFRDPDDGGEY
jgi:hypothetical protein